jgi:hypothetical protein
MSEKRDDVAALGNRAVVQMLEEVLAEARKGKMNHCAVIMSIMGQDPGFGVAGEVCMGDVCKRGIVELIKSIDGRASNGIMPPRDETLGDDYVCYNMVVSPVAFDFLFWLVDAQMRRIASGAPAPLKVAFWKGQDGIGRLNEPIMRQFYDNVMRPLLPMIGAVEVDHRKFMGRCKNLYVPRDIVNYCNEGQHVPKLKAPAGSKLEVAFWLHKRGIVNPVTITLREAQHWDHRNSNLDAWLYFARDLQRKGEQVVFVRDTRRAMERLKGLTGIETTYPEAAIDLHIRTGLYEMAKANLFVANGPAALALFTDKPMFSLTPLEDEGHTYFPNTPSFWTQHMGITPPAQFPWLKPDQFLVYEHDTYENICAAWERLSDALTKSEIYETNHAVDLSVAGPRKDTSGQVLQPR